MHRLFTVTKCIWLKSEILYFTEHPLYMYTYAYTCIPSIYNYMCMCTPFVFTVLCTFICSLVCTLVSYITTDKRKMSVSARR